MELSICIPIYNQNVTSLVGELRRQAVGSPCVYEILLMDDGSSLYLEENRSLGDWEGVRYIRLEENVGRSAIRNRLADEALYEYLVFMDCDVYPENPDFLSRYIAKEGCDVVVGGYHYGASPISDKHILRWKYGKEREERSAEVRSLRPNDSFSTFNFMVRKSVFGQVRFDESLKGYGHEDTLFGLELSRAGVRVEHIDNPLTHLCYDASDVFLEKSRNSVRNLWTIYRKLGDAAPFVASVKLLRCFTKLDKLGVSCVIALFSPIFRFMVEKNLLSRHPSLLMFDIYKLCVLCVCSRE